MTAPAAPRRRWFRYSLRTFFVVLTIFGVWLGAQVKWIRDRHEAANWKQDNGENRVILYPAATAPWSIRIFGEPGYADAYFVVHDVSQQSADEERSRSQVEAIFPEATVCLALSAIEWLNGPPLDPLSTFPAATPEMPADRPALH